MQCSHSIIITYALEDQFFVKGNKTEIVWGTWRWSKTIYKSGWVEETRSQVKLRPQRG